MFTHVVENGNDTVHSTLCVLSCTLASTDQPEAQPKEQTPEQADQQAGLRLRDNGSFFLFIVYDAFFHGILWLLFL